MVLDYGLGAEEPLHVVVEVKGRREADAEAKADTMHTLWVPGVNALKCHGRWAFLELRDPFQMGEDFDDLVGDALRALAEKERAEEFARFLERTGGSMPDIEDIPRRRSAEAE